MEQVRSTGNGRIKNRRSAERSLMREWRTCAEPVSQLPRLIAEIIRQGLNENAPLHLFIGQLSRPKSSDERLDGSVAAGELHNKIDQRRIGIKALLQRNGLPQFMTDFCFTCLVVAAKEPGGCIARMDGGQCGPR